ncbi:PPC domain-containing DNA-binding protein [Gaiella sp.]|jgi:predicted DNA-binding protein with PD1-like motif|uniref:PPC domain-containing DNA-binding protein n=1 Tax=Gaiella sp. TaxID=2663207 RepID=UPI002E2F04AE|nr:PPC domain-containing DNA-binding protein [Gaiella sp.]HEX5585479.1 PPC domain-containing DNA-binding protein [Gaiella sp.]
MKSKLLDDGPSKTYALVFDLGDEVMEGLEGFARAQGLDGAHFTAIGAFSDATLGYFDWERKEYLENDVPEQVEVLTLAGDVAENDGEPAVHAHVVLGRSDGSALGGHLLRAHVRPTLELILTETPAHLRKRHDDASGLALIDPSV